MPKDTNACDMDFIYGYMILKSYFFKIKTNVEKNGYPNMEYTKRWREFCSRVNFESLLKKAFKLISKHPSSDCLNLFDCLDRSSYFALIHKEHPNITLGFVKDADLWDLWLGEGIFKTARKRIAEILSLSNGDKVVDFGCGSYSPIFYGEIVGPNGMYSGIDFSKPLLNLAKVRVRENRLDWVNLRQEYVDSRLIFRRKYDYVICSSILQYADVKAVLRNAVEALGENGVIAIFSEVFSDLEPEKAKLFELYYSLIPQFKRFPSVSEILNYLSQLCECKHKLIDKNYLRIEILDSI